MDVRCLPFHGCLCQHYHRSIGDILAVALRVVTCREWLDWIAGCFANDAFLRARACATQLVNDPEAVDILNIIAVRSDIDARLGEFTGRVIKDIDDAHAGVVGCEYLHRDII